MAETTNQAPETFDILGSARRTARRHQLRRGAEIVAGITLIALGMRRLSLLGIVLGAAGGAFVVRGLTGKRLGSWARHLPEQVRAAVHGPTRDKVDQALLETFPASDPPGY